MNEFEFIASQLKPLAGSFVGALNLEDDAAILTPEKSQEFVVTTDALTAGVHFYATDPPRQIAQKCLRVNLSDIAAMGAVPYCYFLALMLPEQISLAWLAKFCDGLRADQDDHNVHLAGGDTTSINGPLSVAITMIGTVPAGKALKRSTAQIDDDIWVTGTIGDAAMGLQALKGALPSIDAASRDALVRRYHVPQPRNRIAPALRDLATSAIDISDGLAAELRHICAASGVGAQVSASKIPVSDHVLSLLNTSVMTFEAILSGGDDYELMFTANPNKEFKINTLSNDLNLKISKIGRLTADLEVGFIDQDGRMLTLSSNGFRHF